MKQHLLCTDPDHNPNVLGLPDPGWHEDGMGGIADSPEFSRTDRQGTRMGGDG